LIRINYTSFRFNKINNGFQVSIDLDSPEFLNSIYTIPFIVYSYFYDYFCKYKKKLINGKYSSPVHKDSNGQELLVILPLNEFNALIEHLEEMEDIKLYDESKKEDDGKRVLFSDYMKNRNKKNA
jgi:hypothetical protein